MDRPADHRGLIVLNGVFAMSELAIVSARTARLRTAAQQGNGSAQIALQLAAEPGKFLSTVQIGITLIGIIAGAYSGASLGRPVGERLELLGVPASWAEEAGFATVIVVTTYLSLVVGELVPKQVALRAAAPIAIVMARPMALLACGAPLVWLLDVSSGILIRLLGVRPAGQSAVTAEELHMLFAEATRSGVIEHEQHQMLQGVVRLAQRPVRELMTLAEVDGSIFMPMNRRYVRCSMRARIRCCPWPRGRPIACSAWSRCATSSRALSPSNRSISPA